MSASRRAPLPVVLAIATPLAALGLLAHLPWVFVVRLALAGLLVLLTSRRPFWALALLPFAVAFGSLFAFDWSGMRVGPTDVLVAALAVAWYMAERANWWGAVWRWRYLASHSPRAWWPATRGWLARRWRADPPRASVFAAWLAYVLAILLSALAATSGALVVKEALKWLEVGLVLAVTLWLARSPSHVRWLIWALIGAGVAEALLGYAQWVLATGDLGPGGDSLRVFGTFAQPNPYAGELNFALLPALALALWGTAPRERWVAGVAAALVAGASALAGSRGALLGLLAGLAVLLIVGWRRERLAGLAVLIGVPVVLVAWVGRLIPVSLQARLLAEVRLSDLSLSSSVNDANFSTLERLAHWVAGLRMFAAHPLLGVGAGNYSVVYGRYAVPGWPEALGHAHNYYINAAAETGVVGLLAFLALAAAALYAGGRAVRAPRRDGATRALALGLLAVIVALLTHSLTDDLFVHGLELQLALCLGCLLRLGTWQAAAP
ncbi:MAG: O-antigen ligase family protein [Ktedonobacterales bacterium]|nr:O-antigen ligase family protein [Ktedonobacterales bacterium]